MTGSKYETHALLPEVESFLRGPLEPYYGGAFREPAEPATLCVWDPSWHRPLATVGQAGSADVDLAVASARAAFDDGPWMNTLRPSDRQRCIWALAELIERDCDILAQIDSLDSGKPFDKTRPDIEAAAGHLFYYAGWPTKLEGRTYPVDTGGTLAYSVKEPLGVVGLITPWNYPLLMAVWKLAPALASGNCVIHKPAEQTPLSVIYLTRLVEEAGFPPGVFNVLPGRRVETGAPLVEHPGVDKIGFTGSVDVARSIIRGSVGNLKRVSLELGGKSPNIVFADADLDLAVVRSTRAIFNNNGQSCTAGSRLYIERRVYDRVLDGLLEETSEITIGPALSTDRPDLGPLVSSEHLQNVQRWLDKASTSGVRTALGGIRPPAVPDEGYYLAPTVLVDGDDSLPVSREEIFGPVVVAMPFDDLDEVVKRANDTESGLAAGVWTRDLTKAHAIATRVRAGTVWVNSWGVTEPGVPFGGMKQSGHGREMGKPALDLYTETKSVWIGHGRSARFRDYYQLDDEPDYASVTRQFDWRIPDRMNIGGVILEAWEGETQRVAIHTASDAGNGETWSFDRLITLAKRYGQLFQEVGIRRGDRVGIVLPQSAEAAAVHLATYAIGAVALPMSGLYGPESYRFILADSGAVAVVVDGRHAPKIRSVGDELPSLRHLIVHGQVAAGEVPLADGERMPAELEPVDTASDDPALLLYTSGSTGHPKGVLHAHRVLEGYLLTFRLFFGLDFDESAVFYTPSDWAWVGGLLDILLPALTLGYPVVAYDGRFSAEDTLRLMADHRVTHSFLTPTALKMLAQVPEPRERFDLDLHVIGSGGEAVAGDLYRWAAEDLGAVINEFYGLTEVNHLAGGSSTLWPVKPGSMGLPYPGREVAVIDDDGVQVASGVVGEIAVRPGDPTQMIGYWNNDKATQERLRNGWITTGDLAHTDEDGYIYFEGRRDDIIGSAGYRIGPNEIEEVLLQHPSVAEVAVIGSPDSLRGQIVKALVRLRGGVRGDDALASDLQKLVKSRVAAYKYPRKIEFVTDLPKTTTGKINRRLLTQWERDGRPEAGE